MMLPDNNSVIFGTVNLHTHGSQSVSSLQPCLGSTNLLQIIPNIAHTWRHWQPINPNWSHA